MNSIDSGTVISCTLVVVLKQDFISCCITCVPLDAYLPSSRSIFLNLLMNRVLHDNVLCLVEVVHLVSIQNRMDRNPQANIQDQSEQE